MKLMILERCVARVKILKRWLSTFIEAKRALDLSSIV